MIIINNTSDFNINNQHRNSNDAFVFKDCEFNISIPSNHAFMQFHFDNCIFNKPLNQTASFLYVVEITNCTFNESVNLINSDFRENTDIINCSFKKEVNFTESKFKKKVRFHRTRFEESTFFNNSTFFDLADFWNAEFKKITIFYKTDFIGTTVFSSAEFHENVLFTYTLIEKVIILRGTIFKKGLDISLSIIGGNISIFDIQIHDYETIQDFEIANDDQYEDTVSNTGEITDKNKRETFRILKNEASSLGNGIYSLTFASLEMKAYQKSLERDIYKKKEWYKKTQDFIILFLNFWSNKHGKSWFRGIAFTLIVGLIFFYFSLLSTQNYSFGIPNLTDTDVYTNIGYYFVSLSPTHEFDFMKNEIPEPAIFYLWDFVGRAFVAYGIYQTIQAFRKFKK